MLGGRVARAARFDVPWCAVGRFDERFSGWIARQGTPLDRASRLGRHAAVCPGILRQSPEILAQSAPGQRVSSGQRVSGQRVSATKQTQRAEGQCYRQTDTCSAVMEGRRQVHRSSAHVFELKVRPFALDHSMAASAAYSQSMTSDPVVALSEWEPPVVACSWRRCSAHAPYVRIL